MLAGGSNRVWTSTTRISTSSPSTSLTAFTCSIPNRTARVGSNRCVALRITQSPSNKLPPRFVGLPTTLDKRFNIIRVAVVGITDHFIACLAPQLFVYRYAQRFTLNIPQRNIYCTHRRGLYHAHRGRNRHEHIRCHRYSIRNGS